MCGRYTLCTSQSKLEERFDVTVPDTFEPRYNCAPGQALPVITGDSDAVQFMKWGLVPEWSDDGSESFINARAETVREKRSFRRAYDRRRCLVPADGFYEWVAGDDGDTQPYRVVLTDDRPFAMAGLWERWTPKTTQTGLGDFDAGEATADPEPIETFTVVTTEPNDVVSRLHHRMAVVLTPEEESQWLHGDPDDVASLLDPHPSAEMRTYPVSTAVNSPANDRPELIDPVDS